MLPRTCHSTLSAEHLEENKWPSDFEVAPLEKQDLGSHVFLFCAGALEATFL